MKMPAITQSARTMVDEFGNYLKTKLRATKSHPELLAILQVAQTRLIHKDQVWSDSQKAMLTALAVRDEEDDALDSVIRQFSLAVLGLGGTQQDSPVYQKYFDVGMTTVVNAPLECEILKVWMILGKLNEEVDLGLKAYMEPMKAATDKLKEAMSVHRATLEAETRAYSQVQVEKVSWMDTYKLIHKELSHRYGKDTRKAKSFFKPAAAPGRKRLPD